VEMLSQVATMLVGSEGEEAFMRGASAIVRRPSLEAVSRAVDRARGSRAVEVA
jgi:hypothetical protein